MTVQQLPEYLKQYWLAGNRFLRGFPLKAVGAVFPDSPSVPSCQGQMALNLETGIAPRGARLTNLLLSRKRLQKGRCHPSSELRSRCWCAASR
jgi:hypothetical protein